MAQEKVLDIVKSTKSILTPYNVVADGKITSNKNAGLENMDDVYAQRMVLSGSQGYFQAGKKDRDINDQKMMLSGWFGTPLSQFRISMASGIQPQVYQGGVNYDILHRGNMPTPADIGAVAKSGDSMIGQLTLTPGFVDTSVNAQLAHIGKDATKALYIRNMREHNSSAWLWEKVYNGSLYYSSGTNGSGTSKIRLQVSGSGEIYLGVNADKRVYHEGFKPTATDVGAVARNNIAGPLKASLLDTSSEVYAYNAGLGEAGWPWTNSSGTILSMGWSRDTVKGGAELALNIAGRGLAYRAHSAEIGLSEWKQIYHTGFKPTAADVGAVNKTGDTMTGNLTAPKVLLSSAQGTEVNSSTRKDYVDGLISKLRDDINKGMEQLTTVGSWPGV